MPKISVILPVYNAEKYLRESIDSILNQTFTDFELLLINDGSTDRSEEIIKSYADNRIVCIKNEVNQGLIYSLNIAIDHANGEYIARMDSDDIALPDRFQKQLAYLEHSEVSILATRVKLIDEKGNPLPDWEDDARHISPSQIKNFLVKNNCLAHPTIMGKTEVFKRYKYQFNQKYSEDYDLWLRVTNDGLAIHKIEEPLLLYRQLPTSATRFKKVNVFWRLAKVKTRFALHQIGKGKFSFFIFKALGYASIDVIKATGKEAKLLLKR